MAIQSFRTSATQKVFETGKTGKKDGWASAVEVAIRKLDYLHYAAKLEDLRSPPGNRLEALKGDLAGFHSIRINDQWRVIFRWTQNGPEDVYIDDYH